MMIKCFLIKALVYALENRCIITNATYRQTERKRAHAGHYLQTCHTDYVKYCIKDLCKCVTLSKSRAVMSHNNVTETLAISFLFFLLWKVKRKTQLVLLLTGAVKHASFIMLLIILTPDYFRCSLLLLSKLIFYD